MTLTERTAHLKGLIEGMKYDTSTDEGKIIAEIVSILDDITCDVTDMSDELATVNSYVEELDEDLGSLEEYVYDDEDDDDEDDDDECYEVECPACHHTVCFDADEIEDDELVCPACGEKIDLEIEDCDCGCDDCK